MLLFGTRPITARVHSLIMFDFSKIIDPFTGCDLLSQGSVKSCVLLNQPDPGREFELILEFNYPLTAADQSHMRRHVQAALEPFVSTPVPEEHIKIHSFVRRHAVQRDLLPLKSVKNTIAVASGKGGVGKSTVAFNLALALLQQGLKVGLLDADVHGPSQGLLLGHLTPDKPKVAQTGDSQQATQALQPVDYQGLKTMSISYLVGEEGTLVWRGPLISRAVQQMFQQTAWGDLDYLLIDLPPGTGDIPLSMAQKIPLSGALIITTPDELSVADARKALELFLKTGVVVLGVVENMSHFTCPHCQHQTAIFNQGGGAALAGVYQMPLLGQIPILSEEQSKSPYYHELAVKTLARLSLQPRSKHLNFLNMQVTGS